VLAGRFTKRATRDLLERLGYRVLLLDPARSVDDSIDQIRLVAEAIGHTGRGEELVEDIEQARRRAAFAARQSGLTPTAAVYQRRGYVTGADTLTDELLAVVGLANEGGELTDSRGGFVPLERLLAERPDFLVVATADPVVEDQGTALLAHPALVELYPPERRIMLPERLTVCAGPSLPAALDWLSAEVQRLTAVATQ
jgi:iron complex transport system substrate-binding protein